MSHTSPAPTRAAQSRSSTPVIDGRLLEAIQGGNCMAFVGAGISAVARYPRRNPLFAAIPVQSLIFRTPDLVLPGPAGEHPAERLRALHRLHAADDPGYRDHDDPGCYSGSHHGRRPATPADSATRKDSKSRPP